MLELCSNRTGATERRSARNMNFVPLNCYTYLIEGERVHVQWLRRINSLGRSRQGGFRRVGAGPIELMIGTAT